MKHAFITKFNHIRPSVYERYVDILCRDLSVSQGSWIGHRGSVRKVRINKWSFLFAVRVIYDGEM